MPPRIATQDPVWVLAKPWFRWHLQGADQIRIDIDHDECGAWFHWIGQEVLVGFLRNHQEIRFLVSVLEMANHPGSGGDSYVILQRAEPFYTGRPW